MVSCSASAVFQFLRANDFLTTNSADHQCAETPVLWISTISSCVPPRANRRQERLPPLLEIGWFESLPDMWTTRNEFGILWILLTGIFTTGILLPITQFNVKYLWFCINFKVNKVKQRGIWLFLGLSKTFYWLYREYWIDLSHEFVKKEIDARTTGAKKCFEWFDSVEWQNVVDTWRQAGMFMRAFHIIYGILFTKSQEAGSKTAIPKSNDGFTHLKWQSLKSPSTTDPQCQ